MTLFHACEDLSSNVHLDSSTKLLETTSITMITVHDPYIFIYFLSGGIIATTSTFAATRRVF